MDRKHTQASDEHAPEIRGTIHKRGRMLQAVMFVDGKKVRRGLGLRVGQEEEAKAVLAQALAELRESETVSSRVGGLTVRAWGETWIAGRKAREKREWVNERAHLEYFVHPVLGERRLAEITDVVMLDWARSLERFKGPSGKTPSPTYVRKITASVRAMFKEAVRQHLIPENPCTWEDNDLPELEANARVMQDGFTGAQVTQLISDPRIPEDRRMLYALELLTGMRTGEAAARTWADWEPQFEADLGRLTAKTAYNTRHHILKATKTRVEKWIPVHPTLAEMLEAWKREGWERYFGRAPRPEDLIVPAREGRGERGWTPKPRNNSYSWRTFKQDLTTLGLEAQRHYETRATFINLAEGGGAREEAVRRITHPSIRDAKDLYSRVRLRWPAMCQAVRSIQLSPPKGLDTQPDTAPIRAASVTADFTSYPGMLDPTGTNGRARESNPPAAPFSTTHRF